MEQEAVSEGQKQDQIAPGFFVSTLHKAARRTTRKGGPVLSVAQFLVWGHGVDNLPYYHQCAWLTDGWEYTVVELVDWQKETERDLHVTLHCFRWWLEERPDIGV